MRVAVAQVNVTVGDLVGNCRKMADFICRARAHDADIVVFPELAVCGYPPEDLLYKDHFVRDNIEAMRSLARHGQGVTVIAGFVDVDTQGKLYNAAAVIHNKQLKGIYRKEELPNYGVFDEKRYFHSGIKNKIYGINKKRIGISICEDIWVKNGVCQRQIKQGASLLINLSSSPYDVGKLKERERILKRLAKQSGVFVCYANLVGGQDELVFDGGSLVINPDGNIIASALQFEEDLMVVDIDLKSRRKGPNVQTVHLPVQTRAKLKCAIKPHRCAHLAQIERIYQALVLGTRDYAHKNGFQKAILGVSGGIDSALVATVAVDALGKNNVIGVSMPSRYSSKGTQEDARRIAGNLGIQFMEIPIEKIFKIYLSELNKELAGTKVGLAEENLQARIRGNILMTLSNKYGLLVLTTGNKSEVAVGYCTLYGDMTGGFAVIKDVPKTKVYELVKLRNNQGKPVIPESILKRPPSAELRANQKDQDVLPPYSVLDGMLKEYVEQHKSLKEMKRRNSAHVIKDIITMVDRSEYKRRQAPPGIKITPRAFGKDWRLPITNRYKEFSGSARSACSPRVKEGCDTRQS